MKLLLSFLGCLFLLTGISTEIRALGNSYITIVNPVRIAEYSIDPAASLEAEYQVISEMDLSATWLLTYSALNDEGIKRVIKSFNSSQELGIFLEVDEKLANDAGVVYDESLSWHHAGNVFLSGYKQEERIQLIDTVFEVYKTNFGYNPKSVGSWWTDAYSLNYIREKYGVDANLGLSDQYSTDGYQVWGTHWSTPFYPNKLHAGIPAGDANSKIDVVTVQWAPRDPLNGYYSSLYSTQDYKVADKPQDISYFEKLLRFYLEKGSDFGQVTVGLESDLAPDAYRQEYAKQIEVVKRLQSEGKRVVTTSQFGEWYRENFKTTPASFLKSEDFLGGSKKVFWYQSAKYRVGIVYDSEKKKVKIFDRRTYFDDFQEPYFFSPNEQFTLSINIPSYFDEINYAQDIKELSLGEFLSNEENDGKVILNFSGGRILFTAEEIKVEGVGSSFNLIAEDTFIVGPEGYVFKALTEGATRFVNSKRFRFFIALIFILNIGLVVRKRFKYLFNFLFLVLILGLVWCFRNSTSYYVSQSEVEALIRLSQLSRGMVLIYDEECLGCEWNSSKKPAVYANKREYVSKFSRKSTVNNQEIFETNDRARARELFRQTKAKYIYLTTYERQKETLPFSPGDLGVEKIFANANAEIWKVK